MTPRAFEVTLTGKTARTVLHIVAHHTVQAMRIALNTLPGDSAPRRITCKPYKLKRSSPCSA